MSRRTAWAFAALGVAWGLPYLFIKVAVAELDPALLVLARTALAAVLLLPLARRQLGPALRHWPAVLAFAVLEMAIPWLFLARAERDLPSSTTGLLLAGVPLVGVLVGLVTRRSEGLGLRGGLGLALGATGVAALVGLDVAGSDLRAVGELVIVVVGYAVAPAILVRRLGDVPALGVITVSLAMTALLYVPVVALTGTWPRQAPSAPVLWSVVGLATVCTALAFVLFFHLVATLGPVRATSVTFVNPAVAVVAGALLLDERVTVWTLLGFALVVAGSVLVTRRAAPPPPVAGPAVPASASVSGSASGPAR